MKPFNIGDEVKIVKRGLQLVPCINQIGKIEFINSNSNDPFPYHVKIKDYNDVIMGFASDELEHTNFFTISDYETI